MPWQEIGACCGEHSPAEVCRSRLFESAVFESQSRLEMRMITTTDQRKLPICFRPGTSSRRVAEFESPCRPWLLADFEHLEAVYKSFLLTSIDTLVATLNDARLGRVLRLNIGLPPTASPTQEWSFVPVAKTGQELSPRWSLLGRVPNRHACSAAGL